MKLSTLEVVCDECPTKIKVWCECRTPEEVDTIIAWLKLAKSMMVQWEKIRADASQKTQATTGEHEDQKPRKVQLAAQS